MTDQTCCGACGYPVHATKEMACDWCRKSADRIEALTAKLAAIDDLMVRRIKHHQEMKDLKGSGTAQKREHYKMHALSEALGEIRKVTRGEKMKDKPDNSWEIEAQKRINQLAVLVDFARRAERYAKDTGNKFLAEKARATLAEIKGESHE